MADEKEDQPRHTKPGPGSVIVGMANIIEAYAALEDDPESTRVVLMTGICAEIIWGLSAKYDKETILERHLDHARLMLKSMVEHRANQEKPA